MKISENHFAAVSVVSVIGLLIIWVIPNTIALRHLFLISACLSAFGLIRYNWHYFKDAKKKIYPLTCIFGLFAWVIIHYLFFSMNPELEFSEIKGLWMRSLFGAVAAVGLAIAITKNIELRYYFYVALFSTPLINILAYCWASFINNGFMKPADFYRYLFTKIETAYFGAVAASVAIGNLIPLLSSKVNSSKKLQILFWMCGLALVLVSALISNTKNGVAIVLSLCVFLSIVVIINFILSKHVSKILLSLVFGAIVLLTVGVWEGHKSLAYKGWDTVFQDAALGLDIDNNIQWQKREGTVPMPLNKLSMPAATNTYIRFSYAAVGVRLIAEYPMGYGSINRSFWGLQNHAQIPHEHEGQVHSGWIDFGLAFGLPGLLLIFLGMLTTIYFGIKSKSIIVLPWVIFCLAFIPFGLIAEIAWKQYFEATIFFLTLSSTMVMINGFSTSKLISQQEQFLY